MKENEPQTCVTCNRPVIGSHCGVPLSICCLQCCEQAQEESHPLPFLLPQEIVLKLTDFTESDLMLLCCTTRPRHSGRSRRFAQFYLVAELQCLGEALKRREKAKKEKALRALLIQRRHDLLTQLDVMAAELVDRSNRVVWTVLLGDYLTCETPKIKLEDVFKRVAVLDRVEEILETCPGAHPEAAFDFCVMHSRSGPAEFQELKQKIRTVFRIEGRRILQHLCPMEMDLLKGTPLEDEAREFV